MKTNRFMFLPFFLIIIGLVGFTGDVQTPKVSKEEAKAAFEYLTKFRNDTKTYGTQIGIDLRKEKLPVLKWNEILAKVAEERAMDMAKQRYFSHVNTEGYGVNYLLNEAGYTIPQSWYKDKSSNYFESIQAGADSGIDAIKDLIIDKGIPGKGHRKHLLGLSNFYRGMTDIGIGFVKSPGGQYRSYVCVLIAKHDY